MYIYIYVIRGRGMKVNIPPARDPPTEPHNFQKAL